MAFSRIARPKAALALAGLVLGSIGAGEAHAQAFGFNGDATTDWAYIDFNGVHPGLRLDCVAGPSPWCGGGARSSTNGYSTASINTQQGFISGSVSAANVAPPSRVRSAASADGSWWDEFSVNGGNLASDTIVDLRLTVDLAVSGFLASLSTPVPDARVQASINLGGPDAPATAFTRLFADGNSIGIGFLRVRVSTPFTLWGRFFTLTGVDETPLQFGSASGAANYYVDVVGIEGQQTASAMGFAALNSSESLPTLVTASGHDYSSAAAAGGVPEPATWAAMLVGFGGLGAMLRRRRRQVALDA